MDHLKCWISLPSHLQIVCRPSKSLTLKLGRIDHSPVDKGTFGEITINAEETFASKTAVEIVFRCSELENKEFFSKSVSCYLVENTT